MCCCCINKDINVIGFFELEDDGVQTIKEIIMCYIAVPLYFCFNKAFAFSYPGVGAGGIELTVGLENCFVLS